MDDHSSLGHRAGSADQRRTRSTRFRRGPFRNGSRGAPRLDPVRWTPRRRGRLLRTGLVAALLLLAAGVLLSGAGPAAASRCPAGGGTQSGEGDGPPGYPSDGSAGVRGNGSAVGSDIPDGQVGVPVTVGQPGVAALLRPGDRVQLTATATGSARAKILARDLLVLQTPQASSDIADQSMVYLAMTEDQARRVVALGPDTRIGVAVRPG